MMLRIKSSFLYESTFKKHQNLILYQAQMRLKSAILSTKSQAHFLTR